MLIGNAPCSWGVNYARGNQVSWEQYLDEVARAGYRGTELGPLGFMPRDRAALQDALDSRGLTLIGITHVHTFGDRASAPELLRTLRDLAPLMRDLGAPHIVVMDESNWYPEGREGELGADGWRGLVETVREGQAVIEGEFGLKATFHPHIGTAVQFEAEIDRLLDETDIDLCFDTGHHAFWNQDPLAYMNKVWGRIAYMHLKNVDAEVRRRVLDGKLSVAASYGAGVMAPLPDGAVDIKAIMRFLEAKGYDGPVVVEQDVAQNAVETPLQLAARNLAYLQALAV